MRTFIHTPTNGIKKSVEFYLRLGFTGIPADQRTVVADRQVAIEINPGRHARAGVKLYKEDWQPAVRELEKLTDIHKTESGFLLSDPSNAWIYLEETTDDVAVDLFAIKPSVLGNFAGISLETTTIEASFKLWSTLGFEQNCGEIEQGWIGLENEEGFTISLMKPLMCPHLFFNPSMTYFNGKDNPAIIETIRKLQIPIAEEITHFNKEGIVDNIIIRDPGGYGIFVFND